MTDAPDRMLVFGGSFDPPHRAHVELPRLVADQLDCDVTLYIPAKISPHKLDAPPTAAEHRLRMLELALAACERTAISTIELQRDGPSYTADTLVQLNQRYPDTTQLFLLIGADHALGFHRWHAWQRILEHAEPAVMLRPPWDRAAFESALDATYDDDEAAAWRRRIVDTPSIDISATELRDRLRLGRDVGDWLHPDVQDYIRRHDLYRDPPPAT